MPKEVKLILPDDIEIVKVTLFERWLKKGKTRYEPAKNNTTIDFTKEEKDA